MKTKTDKLHFEIEATCSGCGHQARIYLEGKQRDKFLRDSFWLWFRVAGWRWWLLTFTVGTVAGFFFGLWRPQ